MKAAGAQVGLFGAASAAPPPPSPARPRSRAEVPPPAPSPPPPPEPASPSRARPPRVVEGAVARSVAPPDAARRCENCTRPPALRVIIRTPGMRYRRNGAPAEGPTPVDVCTLACAREAGSAGDEITIVRDWRR